MRRRRTRLLSGGGLLSRTVRAADGIPGVPLEVRSMKTMFGVLAVLTGVLLVGVYVVGSGPTIASAHGNALDVCQQRAGLELKSPASARWASYQDSTVSYI